RRESRRDSPTWSGFSETRFGDALLRGGDHLFNPRQFLGAGAARFQGMHKILIDGAIEHFIQETAGQIAEYALAFDERRVNVSFALGPMSYESLLLHHLQQAQHGRVRQRVIVSAQAIPDFANGSAVALPEHFERLQFAIGGSEIGHDDSIRWRPGQIN